MSAIQFFKKSIAPGTDVSSKRLTAFWLTVLGTAVDITTIVLVCHITRGVNASPMSIDAIDRLLYLSIILKVSVFLLMSIITVQDVTGLARAVKGVVSEVRSTATEVAEGFTQQTEVTQQTYEAEESYQPHPG